MRSRVPALVVLLVAVAAVLFMIIPRPAGSRSTSGQTARVEEVRQDALRPDRKGIVSSDERDSSLARAQVWRQPATPISAAYLGQDQSAPRELDCTFEPNPPSGTTPKFDCVTTGSEAIRINNGVGAELPAEAAATRLLTALGFGADSITLVERLRCFGCPKEPFTVMKLVDATHAQGLYERVIDERSYETFQWVALERRFPAPAIVDEDGPEGWAFYELEKVGTAGDGAPRAHVDALRLLSVFLAHWDNKSENQRLVCLTQNWVAGTRCSEPFLLLHDVGSTFGPRKVDLADWERAAIWGDRATCTLSMREFPYKGGTFGSVQVGEEGRLFLSQLLEPLTDAQLVDLFSGARFDRRRAPFAPNSTVDEWVRVFKARRSAIAQGPACPPV